MAVTDWTILTPMCVNYTIPTSSFARFTRSATSPSFTYLSNPVPSSSLCRAAAPQLRPLQLLLPDCIDPLQLLLPICVRFNCSPIVSTSAALPDCVRFNCCSPIASVSSAAPRLHLLVIPAYARVPNVLEHSLPEFEVQ